MPSKYKTRKQEVIEYFNNVIIPELEKKGSSSYDKIVDNIIFYKGVNKKLAIEVLDLYITSNILKKGEDGIITKGKKAGPTL